MPFQRVQREKPAQSLGRQIWLPIPRGILQPGERLPSERDLSERLAVLRASPRSVMADLPLHGLHLAMIEARNNVVMLHMMRSMFQLLREGVVYNRQVMFRQRTSARPCRTSAAQQAHATPRRLAPPQRPHELRGEGAAQPASCRTAPNHRRAAAGT